MSENFKTHRPRYPEWIFSVLGLFFFFVILGSISAVIPTIYSDVEAFITNFQMAFIPNTGAMGPAPINPAAHLNVYQAVIIFSLAFGLYEIVVMGLRILAHSPPWKKAGSLSGMVWWFGAGYLVSIFLNATATIASWFTFWAAIVMLIGGSLMFRGIIIAILR